MNPKGNLEQRLNGIERSARSLDGVSSLEYRILNHLFHDFKGEITTILMCIEAVKDGIWGSVNSKQYSWLETAQRNCNHLVSLINNIRDMSQMEEGSFPAEPEEVDLEQEMQSLNKQFTPIAESRGQILKILIEGPLPKVRFRATIFNRLLNSLVTLVVNNTRQSGTSEMSVSIQQDTLHLSIRYEGVEYDEERLQSVFDKFAQTEMGLQLGRGFTMLFCKEAIVLLGGQIALKPWPEHGNRIEIILPFQKSI